MARLDASYQGPDQIEESFGCAKNIGLLRCPKMRGRRKLETAALQTFTGHNPARMRNLLAPGFA